MRIKRSIITRIAAAAAAAVLAVPVVGVKAQAKAAYDSKYTTPYTWESTIGPAFLNKFTDAKGVYEQLKLGMRYQVMSEGDIMHLYQMDNTNIPVESVRLLYQSGLCSGYLYKTLAGLPYDYTDFSTVFDPDYYVNNNPAIAFAVANGTLPGDPQTLFQNFLLVGMPLGLRGNEDFDPIYFRNNNKVLNAAFGDDNINYYLYYILYGKFNRLKGHA